MERVRKVYDNRDKDSRLYDREIKAVRSRKRPMISIGDRVRCRFGAVWVDARSVGGWTRESTPGWWGGCKSVVLLRTC